MSEDIGVFRTEKTKYTRLSTTTKKERKRYILYHRYMYASIVVNLTAL